MYKNIGAKIKVLAQVLGWLWLAVGIITWLVCISDEAAVVGWAILIVSVSLFLCSWPLYGFGQLVEDVHSMRTQSKDDTEQSDREELPDF